MLHDEVYNPVVWFYMQVNHNAPWDIKRPIPWDKTVGTTYPGNYSSKVVMYGSLMTLEELADPAKMKWLTRSKPIKWICQVNRTPKSKVKNGAEGVITPSAAEPVFMPL
jgi:hypothetical protein